MNLKLIIATLCTLLLVSCAEDKVHKSALLKYDAEIDSIIDQMTLEEKVGMFWHPPVGIGNRGRVLNIPASFIMERRFSFEVLEVNLLQRLRFRCYNMPLTMDLLLTVLSGW